MMKKKFKNIVMTTSFSILLSACSGDNSDLQTYINNVKRRPGEAIEPIPKFSPLPTFKFPESDTRRSPFKPIEIAKRADQSAPDQKRPKQPLEAFPLDALKFVGILKEGSQLWGLILNPEKQIVPIKVGDYMGQNYGQVMSIKNDEITLQETLKNASGTWEKHMTTIHLDSGKGAKSA